MSVKQLSNGEWCYRFDRGENGYRGWHFKTKTEAQKAEIEKKAEVARKSMTNELKNDIKLVEVAKMFFEQHSRPCKKNWKADVIYIRSINEFFGSRRIKDIGPLDVDRFRQWIRENNSAIYGDLISLNTVNHYHAALKAIIQWAIKRRLFYGLNPAWGIPMAKVPRAKVRYLLPEEERRLTPCVAKRSRLWPFYVVALHTGMRIGEIQSTSVENVILHPEPMIFIPNPKNSRSRYVPLYGISAELMATRIQNKPPQSPALDPWSYQVISDWFEDALDEAKIKNFTFHCLRHTFASHMLGKGVPIYKVSKILGHSSVKVTEDHYGHLDKSVLFEEIHNIKGVISLPNVLPDMQGYSSPGFGIKSDAVIRYNPDVPSKDRQNPSNDEIHLPKMSDNDMIEPT